MPMITSAGPTDERRIEFQLPPDRDHHDHQAPSVQRQTGDAPVAAPDTGAATSGGSPAAAPSPAAPGHALAAPSSAELEELAKRLYEPLSARFRAELWLDRERAGLVTDRRR